MSARARNGMVSEARKRAHLFHFNCITSCLLAHCLFGRFFLAFLPLYSGGSDATLAHLRLKLSFEQRYLSCLCSKSTCFIRRVPDPRRVRKESPRDERRRAVIAATNDHKEGKRMSSFVLCF